MGKETSSHGCSVLPLFMILFTITSRSSHAADTLSAGESLHDGEKLISANGTFELGFFSPPNSNYRYLGIWYHKLPGQTVVWVANRDRPVQDSSGFLTIDPQGNLLILDSIGTPIPIASNPGSTNLTSATLLDSGNFILKNSSSQDGQRLWQSFDYPTDTFLAGMRLGLDGRKNRLLNSWRSSDDPEPGDFSIGIDPNGTQQFFLWYKGQVQWKSGVWNGINFTLVKEMVANYYVNFSYIPHWSNGYYYYSLGDSPVITRGVMEPSGQFKQLTWLESEQQWSVFWVEPKDILCEVPVTCGANGLCRSNSSTTCQCMFGFVPSSYQQWQSDDWSAGCTRQTQMQCEQDEFFGSTNVKLPIFSSRDGNSSLSLKDCKSICTRNCSCTAYASANLNGTGCLFWSGDLLGLQDNYVGSQDIYVRIAASELAQKSGNKRRALFISIPVAAVAVVFLLGILMCCYARRKQKGERETSRLLPSRASASTSSTLSSDLIRPGEGNKGSDSSLFSFNAMSAATGHFSASNKLGQGGFGPVYKGLLEGQQIAVKRLSRTSGQGLKEFQNEINLIANLQHKNLVRLLGHCIENDENILVYEYMPNKSLDYYIFDPVRGSELSWPKRLVIIEGIAQGLLYLHKYSRFRVIHRDVKTSNILLDSEMNPKISDFGLARIFEQNEDEAKTTRVVGTYGYMPPEYAMGGLFSIKSDVFSFGVIVLEIVSGRKNTHFYHVESSSNLLRYSWELWRDGKSLELIDTSLGNPHHVEEISRCIHIALLCVQERAADRPTMSEVVSMLTSENASLAAPNPPGFFLVAPIPKENLSSCLEEICSANNVTVTALAGR